MIQELKLLWYKYFWCWLRGHDNVIVFIEPCLVQMGKPEVHPGWYDVYFKCFRCKTPDSMNYGNPKCWNATRKRQLYDMK